MDKYYNEMDRNLNYEIYVDTSEALDEEVTANGFENYLESCDVSCSSVDRSITFTIVSFLGTMGFIAIGIIMIATLDLLYKILIKKTKSFGDVKF
jgi:hypothetical protein